MLKKKHLSIDTIDPLSSLESLAMPLSDKGFIPTLNHYGYMLETPDEYSMKFIAYAGTLKSPVLDIGAAYGVTTIPALEKGATVVANDLDERHLYLLEKRVPAYLKKHLILLIGKFPHQVNLEPRSFGAVLASGVLHYLEGEELEEAFLKIFNILIKGGKFFFCTSTPYIEIFKNFLPIFQKRKQENLKWPGLMENSWFYAPHRRKDIPRRINLLDEDTLMNLFKKIGFQIEEKGYVSMNNCPPDIQSQGKEYIGFVLKKP